MMNTCFCQVRFYIKKTDVQIKSIKIVSKRKKSPKFGAPQIHLQNNPLNLIIAYTILIRRLKQSTGLDDYLRNLRLQPKLVSQTV